jgi:hypothetical protein
VAGQSGPAGQSANLFLFDSTTGTNTLITHNAAASATVANGTSGWPVLSADGRYAAYYSDATNLVSGYVPAAGVNLNVYLWDRSTGASTLVSHAAGLPLNGGATSEFPSISTDGRWIAYDSVETNLVAGVTDSNNTRDVFLYDRDAGTNQLVDHPNGTATATPAQGADQAVISGDGNWIVFRSTATDLVAGQTGVPNFLNLFLTERATGNTVLVTHVDGAPTTVVNSPLSSMASISDDGSWIAYDDDASTLTPGDSNGKTDVFLYGRAAGTNTLVSHRAGSANASAAVSFAPWLSADGSAIAFESNATDLDAGALDLNGTEDIFLYDRSAGTNALISKHAAGMASLSGGGDSTIASFPAGAMSRDGRWVAFTSYAANLVAGQVDANNSSDVFLRDRTNGTTILVSRSTASATTTGNKPSSQPTVSDDGRWVAFSSLATDLAAGQIPASNVTNIFLFDRQTGSTTLVSHSSASATTGGNNFSSLPNLSSDGSRLVFLSSASDLIAGATDTNVRSDVFLYDRAAGATTLVSHAAGLPLTAANDASSLAPRLLADGSGVLFQSLATNLIPGENDTNLGSDLFLFDPATGATTLINHAAGSPATTGNGGTGLYAASRDNRWILYDSSASDLVAGVTANNGGNVYLYDRQSGTSSLVSHAAGNPNLAVNFLSQAGDISADGSWIAFMSESTNLVSGQTPNLGLNNIFLQDRATGTTTLVSHVPNQPAGSPCCGGGAFYPRLSGDGSKVAYYAFFGNLVAGQVNQGNGVFLYDRLAGENAVVSHTPAAPTRTGNGPSDTVEMSADGSAIVFNSHASDLVAGDFNGAEDVFVYSDGLPGAYYTVPPCRLFDSRLPADGPAIFSGQTKIVQVHGICGIPDTAKALEVNVTIVQPTGNGYLTLHPGDVLPTVTSTVNFTAGQVLANNAAQRLAVNTTGTVALTPLVGGNGTVHVVIDVAGYFE